MKKRLFYLHFFILVLIGTGIIFFNENYTTQKSITSTDKSFFKKEKKQLENKKIETQKKKSNITPTIIEIIKKKINTHLPRMQYIGEGAEKQYQESIEELKKNRDIATEVLFHNYQNTREENYLKRQQLIETMRAIQSRKSIPIFTTLLMEKFPEEKSEDLHHGSTQLEEGIIRLTAIEGLGYFAKEENNEEVLLTLLEIIKNKVSPLPLKRQAVREYLHSSSDEKKLFESKELIKEYLPKSEHFIVTKKIDEPENQLPDFDSPKLGEPHLHDHHHKSEAPVI